MLETLIERSSEDTRGHSKRVRGDRRTCSRSSVVTEKPDGDSICVECRKSDKAFLDRVPDKEKQMSVWTILFLVLLIAWIGGFTVFHVAGGLIHLLLVFAVVSLILHFVLGERTV